LGQCQVHSQCLGDEYCRHTLVKAGSVHVDGGSQRKHKAADLFRYPDFFFHLLHGHRKGGRTRARGEGQQLGRADCFEEIHVFYLGEHLQNRRVHHQDQEEQSSQLRRAIGLLSSVNKAIILLYLEGHSYDEISEITGLTKSNVSVRLVRIKKELEKPFFYIDIEYKKIFPRIFQSY
jgi:RNA polymerase sigma factor (sigma-70 family)